MALMRGQHPGGVAVDVDQAVGPGPARQLQVGQVDRQRRAPGADVLGQLVGHELADVDLGLLGAAADVGGQDHVGETLQAGHERLVLARRLVGEHVDGGAGQMSRLDVGPQGAVVDDEAAAQVEERAPGSHGRELGLAEQAAVVRPAVDVEGDHVGPGRAARRAMRSRRALPSASRSAVS